MAHLLGAILDRFVARIGARFMWIRNLTSAAACLATCIVAYAQSTVPPAPATSPATSPSTSPVTHPSASVPASATKPPSANLGDLRAETQTTRPLAPSQLAVSTTTPEPTPLYRFQVDDVVRIEVHLKEEPLNSTDCIVGPDGNISAPLIGLVRAEGRTVTELFEFLKQEYKRIKFTQEGAVRLSVTPIRFHLIRATVSGAVNKTGVYEMKRGDRISTLLATALGVPTDGSADLRRATLHKAKSRELIPIDVYDLLTKGDSTQDYEIEDGDILTIPTEIRNRISIDGEVKQPIVIPFTEGLSVAQAITRAGGRTENSKMSKVTVVRLRPGRPDDPEYIDVDLVKFYSQKDRSQNPELKPGDIVYVPNNGNPNFAQINSYFNFFYLLRTIGFNPFGF